MEVSCRRQQTVFCVFLCFYGQEVILLPALAVTRGIQQRVRSVLSKTLRDTPPFSHYTRSEQSLSFFLYSLKYTLSGMSPS